MHGGVPIQFLCRKFKSVRYISKKNRIFSFPAVLSGFRERCPRRVYLHEKKFLTAFFEKIHVFHDESQPSYIGYICMKNHFARTFLNYFLFFVILHIGYICKKNAGVTLFPRYNLVFPY